MADGSSGWWSSLIRICTCRLIFSNQLEQEKSNNKKRTLGARDVTASRAHPMNPSDKLLPSFLSASAMVVEGANEPVEVVEAIWDVTICQLLLLKIAYMRI
jgi:hypothetical protein